MQMLKASASFLNYYEREGVKWYIMILMKVIIHLNMMI